MSEKILYVDTNGNALTTNKQNALDILNVHIDDATNTITVIVGAT